MNFLSKSNEQSNKSLFIFDWDDTLFPTSWSFKQNINLKQENKVQYINIYKELDVVLYNIFMKLLKSHYVIIITNASVEWVKLSMSVLLNTSKILNNVKIISAKEKYHEYNNPSFWKIYAFNDEVNIIIKKNKLKSVISLGDALYEYNALVELYHPHKHNIKYFKTVKFLKDSTLNTLMTQLMLVFKSLDNLADTSKHLDLNIQILNN